MKQDYLWDKTGADPEIESLENALAVFRYKEIAPPALPAKIIPFKKESPRRSFRFAYAIAACTAFVMIGLGVWFQFSTNETATQENFAQTIQPQILETIPDVEAVENPAPIVNNAETSPKTKIESAKRISAPKPVKKNRIIPAVVRQPEKRAGNIVAKKSDVQLTKEEQYAYDQLMLALSITSSKLKLVKDKVEGFEE
ncbi:MAG TPA: hypothetical protein VF644_07085 [Pyrinomonadaceae bacterium]|jgi:hypothetical protein